MNPVLASIPGSLIRELNARKTPDCIDLGLGEPTLRPDPEPLAQAAAYLGHHGCPYSPNAGFTELREAIAAHYAYPGLGSAANVCVTHGSQEALYLAIKALLDPSRDEVLVPEPAYPAYAKIAMMEGIGVRTVPFDETTGFCPTAERLLEAVGPRTRMIVLGSPSNPSGAMMPRTEAEALARGLLALADPPWVLADEVYRELVYTEAPYVSLAECYPHTLVANSLSKSNALTGLRLGFLMGPAPEIAAAIKVHQFVTTAASTFSQRVAMLVYGRHGALSSQLPHYRHHRQVLLSALSAHGIAHLPPDGAFYTLVRLPEQLASDPVAAAHALIDRQRVVAVPGIAFGAACAAWFRLSFVSAPEALEEGARRIATYFAEKS